MVRKGKERVIPRDVTPKDYYSCGRAGHIAKFHFNKEVPFSNNRHCFKLNGQGCQDSG